MRKTLRSLVFCCLLAPAAVRAELYECNGTWTNRPCDGPIGKTFEEKMSPPDEGAARNAEPVPEPLAPRLDLIRRLRKVSDDYRRENGIHLSRTELDNFRRLCEDRSKPFEECSEQYQSHRERLISQNQNKEKLELDAERNRIEADKVDAIRRR